MTRHPIIGQDQLAAFADGELSPENAAAVVIHLADHPEDQAFVDEVMAANVALARAFHGPMQERVPDRFTTLIMPNSVAQKDDTATVVPFVTKARSRPWGGATIAAGLAVAAALTAVAILPGSAPGFSVGPVAANSDLHQILSATSSGVAVQFADLGTLTVLASLPGDAGFCREFELLSTDKQQIEVGLACTAGTTWVVDVLVAETVSAGDVVGDDYVPAASEDSVSLEKWLERRGAGLTLTPREEAAVMASGWIR